MERRETEDLNFSSERKQYNDQLFEVINNLNSSFINEFSNAIESKDFVAIEGALNKGALLLHSAIIANELDQQTLNESVNIINESVDLSQYDFNSPSDMESFINDSEIAFAESLDIESLPGSRGTCVALAGVLVVATLVWEVVAVVNVAALTSVAAWVFALYDVYASGGGGGDEGPIPYALRTTHKSLEKETLIAEIAFLN